MCAHSFGTAALVEHLSSCSKRTVRTVERWRTGCSEPVMISSLDVAWDCLHLLIICRLEANELFSSRTRRQGPTFPWWSLLDGLPFVPKSVAHTPPHFQIDWLCALSELFGRIYRLEWARFIVAGLPPVRPCLGFVFHVSSWNAGTICTGYSTPVRSTYIAIATPSSIKVVELDSSSHASGVRSHDGQNHHHHHHE